MVVFPEVVIPALLVWLPTEASEVVFAFVVITPLAMGYAFSPGLQISTFATFNYLHIDVS